MTQIASIPGNGTQFLLRLLQENDIKVTDVGHLTDSLDLSGWGDIICPVRPPRAVAYSWAKREHNYGWDAMYERLKTIPAHFFFIDDRGKALDRLEDYLGKELTTDWALVNHCEARPLDAVVNEQQIRNAEDIYHEIKMR